MTPVSRSTSGPRLGDLAIAYYEALDAEQYNLAFEIKQEMLSRCGDEHTETHLKHAREIRQMLGLDD